MRQRKISERQQLKNAHKTNRHIRAIEVRVIGTEGEMLGVMRLEAALEKAKENGVDLVETVSSASPPICRLIEYGKFLYQQEKKRKENKKNQKSVQLKEIKMRPKTDVHDYNFKIKHVRQFLTQGDKVKITIRFRGREMAFQELGRERMNQIIEDTKDLAKPENRNRLQGRDLSTILTPISTAAAKTTKSAKSTKTPKVDGANTAAAPPNSSPPANHKEKP